MDIKLPGITAIIVLGALVLTPAFAATLPPTIDDNDVVVLQGNVHPLARPGSDVGRADATLPMERMTLSLRLAPDRQAALDELLAEQQDPGSSNFHRWLTPEEYGARFGRSQQEISLVTAWLGAHGFVIDWVAKSLTWINFTGTAWDVENAFHTQIHDYVVEGQLHHANATDPAIPRALSGLVAGVVSLHDFRAKPAGHLSRPATNVSGGGNWLSPGDFATIYDVNPLYTAGITGTGQSIAVVGRTDIKLTDVQNFRSFAGLPANNPQFIVNGSDPGIVSSDEEGEGNLDVEWAGAIAKNATIKFVISASTNTSDGSDLSAQYIVDNNLAPVVSTSFNACESAMGTTENAFYSGLWAQAAAQGTTVFVAAGDSGAAECDDDTESSATGGLAVSGLCSTPFDVCVGGTEFLDSPTSAYWSPTNNSTTTASALSYIPEAAWNESGNVAGGSDLWATNGGVSTVYSKPPWQVAPGVPSDGARDVPDVVLAAAAHNPYIVFQDSTSPSSAFYGASGTSAAAPSFASVMALIVQKAGTRQGNANVRLYQLGNAQYGDTGPTVFHDITTGNNSVPGQAGYSCTVGYDLVTGLGSVDVAALANNWAPGVGADFTVSASPPSVSAYQNSAAVATVTIGVTGGFSATTTLTASGLPVGATATFAPNVFAAPGAGTSSLTLAADGSTPAGTYTVTVTATGGGTARSTTVAFTVNSVPSSGTVTIFSDGFEGSFPGPWQIGFSTGGDQNTYWGKTTCQAASGSASLWCAGGGTSVPACGGDYPANMGTFAIYGPFSLIGATAATLDFDLWLDCGASDSVQWLISTDSQNFDGPGLSGSTGGWTHETLNFSDVTDIPALGASQVWIGFYFSSTSGNQYQGAFVDNVAITATFPAPCTYSLNATSLSVTASGGTGSIAVTPSSSSCAWTATSNAAWITVTSGASGTGNGSVGFSVGANSGPARGGTITVAGQTFTVNQAAGGTSYAYSYWLPVISHTAGAGGTEWRSDVGVLNRSASSANIEFLLYTGGGTLTQTDTVTGSSQVIEPDLAAQLGFTTGSGALQVLSTQPLLVTSRTYDVASSGFTYGQGYDGIASSNALAAGQTAFLPQLSQNGVAGQLGTYRTNIGITNTGSSDASVTLTLFSADGTQVWTDTESYSPGQFYQYQEPYRTGAGLTNVSAGYAEITVNSGSGVIAYASVIDNASGDPTTFNMKE